MPLRGPKTVRSLSRRRVVALMFVTGVIACSAAICQVWTRLRAIEFGYKISEAVTINNRLKAANRRLRLEAALLKNPTRIARIASEELGLGLPKPEQIRRLRLHPERPSESPHIVQLYPPRAIAKGRP